MSNLYAHGTPPEYRVLNMTTDRYSITTATAERKFVIEDGFDPATYLKVSAAPQFIGIPCVAVRASADPGFWTFEYGYEGQLLDVVEDSFELDVGSVQEDIRTHPDLIKLEKIYGKYDPDYGFPKKAISKTADEVPSGIDPEDMKKKSPLFGVTGYLQGQLIWRRTTLRKILPPDIHRNLFCIESPPKPKTGSVNIPTLPAVSTWLKTSVRANWRGNVWQISEEWMASGRYGWNKHIYRKYNGGGGSASLSTGSLAIGSL